LLTESADCETAMASDAHARSASETSLLAEASNQMVRLYKDYFGRGPTKSRADWAGPDLLVCTLENSFTPAEKRMAEMGEHQRLRDTRLFFQYAILDEFIGTIERLTRRRVRAFVSGTDTEQDVSSELFYFEPAGA
jgi:uncharacterized protein YbcI